MEKRFVIYTLSHPKTRDVRYVGWTSCGLKTRLSQHLRESKTSRKTHKLNWIRFLLKHGLVPRIDILEVVAKDTYEEKEIYWINHFGRNNLTNATDGGGGTVGYIHTPEQRAANSARTSGESHYCFGKHLPKKTRKRIGDANRGEKNGMFGKTGTMRGKTGENHPCWEKECSPETRKKISEAQKGKRGNNWGKHPSQKTLDKMSKSMMGKNQGEKCAGAKLNDEKVLRIRRLHKDNPDKYTRKKLSKMFNVSPSTIGEVIRRETWRHI